MFKNKNFKIEPFGMWKITCTIFGAGGLHIELVLQKMKHTKAMNVREVKLVRVVRLVNFARFLLRSGWSWRFEWSGKTFLFRATMAKSFKFFNSRIEALFKVAIQRDKQYPDREHTWFWNESSENLTVGEYFSKKLTKWPIYGQHHGCLWVKPWEKEHTYC